MSATRARARRSERDGRPYVIQAHYRLHNGNVDGAHESLHVALGTPDSDPSEVARVVGKQDFDRAFRDLCIRHGVRAAYVLVAGIIEGHAQFATGGDAEVQATIDEATRRLR